MKWTKNCALSEISRTFRAVDTNSNPVVYQVETATTTSAKITPLREWGSLTMSFTGKFVYMAHHFILLRLNPFGLRADRDGGWFEHSMS